MRGRQFLPKPNFRRLRKNITELNSSAAASVAGDAIQRPAVPKSSGRMRMPMHGKISVLANARMAALRPSPAAAKKLLESILEQSIRIMSE